MVLIIKYVLCQHKDLFLIWRMLKCVSNEFEIIKEDFPCINEPCLGIVPDPCTFELDLCDQKSGRGICVRLNVPEFLLGQESDSNKPPDYECHCLEQGYVFNYSR